MQTSFNIIMADIISCYLTNTPCIFFKKRGHIYLLDETYDTALSFYLGREKTYDLFV